MGSQASAQSAAAQSQLHFFSHHLTQFTLSGSRRHKSFSLCVYHRHQVLDCRFARVEPWSMSSCKSSIMRGTCADCEPRSSSSNDPTSRELPIPSPQSPCSFCRLVGKVFEYYFGDVSAKYRYGTDYDCFDELYLHFRDVDGHRHYVQVYINGKSTTSHLMDLF